MLRLKSPRRAKPRKLPRLWFLSDDERVKNTAVAIESLPKGCGVILRDYRRPNREKWAQPLIRLCRAQGRMVLVAGDVRLAARVGADGVHFPRWSHRLRARSHQLRPRPWIISASAHNRREMIANEKARVDLIFISPVFNSQSHLPSHVLGFHGLARLRVITSKPVFALGGMNNNRYQRLKSLTLSGWAGIGALLNSRAGR